MAARPKRAMVAARPRAPSRRVYVAEGSDTPRRRRVERGGAGTRMRVTVSRAKRWRDKEPHPATKHAQKKRQPSEAMARRIVPPAHPNRPLGRGRRGPPSPPAQSAARLVAHKIGTADARRRFSGEADPGSPRGHPSMHQS